jgi:hypothetical protein
MWWRVLFFMHQDKSGPQTVQIAAAVLPKLRGALGSCNQRRDSKCGPTSGSCVSEIYAITGSAANRRGTDQARDHRCVIRTNSGRASRLPIDLACVDIGGNLPRSQRGQCTCSGKHLIAYAIDARRSAADIRIECIKPMPHCKPGRLDSDAHHSFPSNGTHSPNHIASMQLN